MRDAHVGRQLALCGCLTLLGCGRAEPAAAVRFAAAAQAQLVSRSGALSIAVRTSPQPPARGANVLQLTVTDAAGAKVEGLHLDVQPWMPDMGHGASVTPEVSEPSAGVYLLSSIYFSMPGLWQVRVETSGEVNDGFVIGFEVP